MNLTATGETLNETCVKY